MLPHAPHAREVVLELCELDLQLALGAAGVLGEDVEDQLGPVDDAGGQSVLEVPLLRRAQFVVDEQRIRASIAERAGELGQLPLAHVAPLVGPSAPLNDLPDRLDAGRPRQLAELAQLLVVVVVRAQHGDDESPLGLQALSRVRLAVGHD